MTPEEEQYMMQLEDSLNQAHNQNSMKIGSSIFNSMNDPNLIQWQLELDNILERIDHLLRGHELKFDDKGNLSWEESDNKNNKIFNEYGVQEILRILSMYLNRNTILSNYDEETINLKVYDFGMEITDLVFMKYEQMFNLKSDEQHLREIIKDNEKELIKLKRNNKELYREKINELKKELKSRKHDDLHSKIKLYPITIRELVDTVHSAYLRALAGGERESLRTARTVNQTEPLRQPTSIIQSQQQSKGLFSKFNPFAR